MMINRKINKINMYLIYNNYNKYIYNKKLFYI